MGMKKVKKLIKKKGGIRLDIGSGGIQRAGFVGMDKRELPGIDIVHDWNDYPWPLPDESCVIVLASHVVEHVDPADGGFLRWMDELWRICNYDAEVAIVYPHGSSQRYLQDPTHCNPMNERVWGYFDPLEPKTGGALYRIYKPKPWRIKDLGWNPEGDVQVVLVKRREDVSYG